MPTHRLIDIAGRTGHAPVRALLTAAAGTTDLSALQPHEIRYRNDQHHVIYGLYDGDQILGLIGYARQTANDSVEILHIAAYDDDHDLYVELLTQLRAREAGKAIFWQVPEKLEHVARNAGLTPTDAAASEAVWIFRPQ